MFFCFSSESAGCRKRKTPFNDEKLPHHKTDHRKDLATLEKPKKTLSKASKKSECDKQHRKDCNNLSTKNSQVEYNTEKIRVKNNEKCPDINLNRKKSKKHKKEKRKHKDKPQTSKTDQKHTHLDSHQPIEATSEHFDNLQVHTLKNHFLSFLIKTKILFSADWW